MKKAYYHYDRRNNLSGIKILENNRNALGGFFMNLFFNNSMAKKDLGNVFKKVDDFIFYEKNKFDFIDEIIAKFSNSENLDLLKLIFELIFENKRREINIELPSRTRGLFTVDNKLDLEYWINNRLKEEGTCYIIEPKNIERVHYADSSWFELCSIDSIDKIDGYADKYWRGIKSNEPNNEIIIIGEFLIRKCKE